MSVRALEEWIRILLLRTTAEFGKTSLAELRGLAQRLGVGSPAPWVVTVGGTNGKGSTCRALEILALSQGYKVGVYASPHLLSYTERVRVQGVPVTERELAAACDAVEAIGATESVSFFEWITLAALVIFKQRALDLVILEVGLGGRLDAVNMIDSNLAVITTIDYDHTHILGETLNAIAREKSGIMRRGCPTVIGERNPPQCLLSMGKALDSRLLRVGHEWSWTQTTQQWGFEGFGVELTPLPLPSLPVSSVATAAAVFMTLLGDLSADGIAACTPWLSLPGRFQTLQSQPLVIADVAHNPQSMRYLAWKIKGLMASRKLHQCHLVCSMLRDKAIAVSVSSLLGCVSHWYSAPLQGSRAASLSDLKSALPSETQFFEDIRWAYEAAVAASGAGDVVVVCGSFYVVSAVMDHLGISAKPVERPVLQAPYSPWLAPVQGESALRSEGRA